uniref:Uncharacterized protein n=1 Tax=Anguilla anguilla TaxID=7936 RepID=A0A0E9U6M7_ANGAN
MKSFMGNAADVNCTSLI